MDAQLLVPYGEKGLFLLVEQVGPLVIAEWNAVASIPNIELSDFVYDFAASYYLLLLNQEVGRLLKGTHIIEHYGLAFVRPLYQQPHESSWQQNPNDVQYQLYFRELQR